MYKSTSKNEYIRGNEGNWKEQNDAVGSRKKWTKRKKEKIKIPMNIMSSLPQKKKLRN